MTLEEFLVWDAPPGVRWQLVDGQPVAMAPANDVHGTIQGEIGGLVREHLRTTGGQCRLVVTPGIRLGVRSDSNYRIPDLGVTCTPSVPGLAMMPDPLVLIEILSSSNHQETGWNVWAYTTIPTVREILVVRSDSIGVQLLRRAPDGSWPPVPMGLETGTLTLESIGLTLPLIALYTGTWLAA